MADYILFMHNDTDKPVSNDAWAPYFVMLQKSGQFLGGSAIGGGICINSSGQMPDITEHLNGFIRVNCTNIEDAKTLLTGNPVLMAGGTVEIRELPKTG